MLTSVHLRAGPIWLRAAAFTFLLAFLAMFAFADPAGAQGLDPGGTDPASAVGPSAASSCHSTPQ